MSQQVVQEQTDLAPVIDVTITHFPATEEDIEHYEVHAIHSDKTRTSIGGAKTYERARIIRAKYELGIPNAINTWWTSLDPSLHSGNPRVTFSGTPIP